VPPRIQLQDDRSAGLARPADERGVALIARLDVGQAPVVPGVREAADDVAADRRVVRVRPVAAPDLLQTVEGRARVYRDCPAGRTRISLTLTCLGWETA
jgi:hypothetical protein